MQKITSNPPPLFILSIDLEARTHVLRCVYPPICLSSWIFIFFLFHFHILPHSFSIKNNGKSKRITRKIYINYKLHSRERSAYYISTFPELFNFIDILCIIYSRLFHFFFFFVLLHSIHKLYYNHGWILVVVWIFYLIKYSSKQFLKQ